MKQPNTREELLKQQDLDDAADEAAFLRAIEKKKNAHRTVDEIGGAAFDASTVKDAATEAEANATSVAEETNAAFDEGSVLAGAKKPRTAVRRAVREISWHFPTPKTPRDTTEDRTEDENIYAPNHEKKAFRRFLTVVCVILCTIILGYTVFVFVPIPFVRKWRDIYIGTAMTTGDHQWLATYFIPKGIIDSVMNENTIDTDVIGGLEHLTRPTETEETLGTEGLGTASDTEEPPVTEPIEEPDILGLNKLTVGGLDYAGNEVTVVDKDEGLFISKIDGGRYKGLVMLIDDPARIFVGTTPEKTTRGYRIGEMMSYYGDVVAGINASGFSDPNDSGRGCDIIGYCMSQGESWGNYSSYMASIVFTQDNKLVVGVFDDWESYGIRDGMQFGPVLVANGEINIKAGAAASFGLHPRTAIGQRADGAIILLVIDGRDLTHSIGCTIEDMANIMMTYNAENAGCCDGGSSCVLAYEGEVLNKNSSANPTYGRRIPNAFLVRSKKAQSAENES